MPGHLSRNGNMHPGPAGACPICRSTTTQRGYGTVHQKLRARVAKLVRAGSATCARCGRAIAPTEPWDLGHDDTDRTRYTGPEHRKCNRGARP